MFIIILFLALLILLFAALKVSEHYHIKELRKEIEAMEKAHSEAEYRRNHPKRTK